MSTSASKTETTMTKTADAEEEITDDRTAESSDGPSNHATDNGDNNTKETRGEAKAEVEDGVDAESGGKLSPIDSFRNPKISVFLDAYKILDLYWPTDFNSADVKEYLDELEKVPYMKNCLREDIARARKILSPEDGERIEGLSPEDEALVAKLPQKFQQKCREKLMTKNTQIASANTETALANKKIALWKIRSSIISTLECDKFKAHEVRYQLLSLAGLNQAESSLSHTSTSTADSQNSVTESIDDPATKKHKVDERSELFILAEPASVYSSILQNYADIEDVLPGLSKPSADGKATTVESRLQKVVGYFEDYLAGATFVCGEAHDGKKVEAAINGLRDDIRNATSEPSDHCGGQEQEQKTAMSTSTTFKYAPGASARETEGAQPWIRLLFQSIGACREPSSSDTNGPGKIDFLLQKEGRWEAVILNDILTVPVEVTSGCRKGKTPKAHLEGAVDQVLSRLAKHLYFGVNFAGYGVPCHMTGVVVCMAAIQILQLRYENVGTPDVKLVLYKSALMPLMKADNFQRWTKSVGQRKQQIFGELRKELYGPKGEDGLDRFGVPKGVRALHNLMNQPGKKLRGLSVEIEDSGPRILDVPLGSGATAIVFSKLGNESHVVKLSRSGTKGGIEHETKILKLLAGTSVNDHLPRIVDNEAIPNGKLQIRLGSIAMALPAIELSPAGQNASVFLTTSGEPGLHLIYTGITSALKHMHSQNICHCDVTPKNIIIAPGPQPRAVLIDYSFARDFIKASLRGFHGTPDYAHREIFANTLGDNEDNIWKSRPEHDKAGLGFTLAFFANGSIRPWKGINLRFTVHDEEMADRLEIARDAIKTVGEPLKSGILELLGCDEL